MNLLKEKMDPKNLEKIAALNNDKLNAFVAEAIELTYKECILETGIKQPEAIGLYLKNDYKIIPNYGQYAEAENSVCFRKVLDIR